MPSKGDKLTLVWSSKKKAETYLIIFRNSQIRYQLLYLNGKRKSYVNL